MTLTGQWIAAGRARETGRADRLFDDPFAESLAGQAGFDMMSRSDQITGQNVFIRSGPGGSTTG